MEKNKRVNWHGRMKISPSHFQQTENYFIDQLSDCREISQPKYGYGLLPVKDKNQDVGIQIRESISNHVEVRLYSCNAITASGERINFNVSNNEEPLSKVYSPHQDKSGRDAMVTNWDVILTVDPYERVLCGELNPSEEPPRHPDCDSSYKLDVVPSSEVNISAFGSHFLTIGKIRKDGERYMVDANYIPPCVNMAGHPDLTDYCHGFDASLYSIRKSAKDIISKVSNRPSGSELAANIRVMSESILKYIASIHFNLKNIGVNTPPVSMSGYISTLASHCFVNMVCLPSVQKDELLKYFYEWSDVTPGSFEELLAETMDMEYDHNNIRSVMVRLEVFVNTLCELLERLSRLEYIGQHKESLVVSASGGEGRGEDRRGFMVSD